MTVREINVLTRDGGNGRNVYACWPGFRARVSGARTRRRVMQVRLLLSGEWMDVRDDVSIEVSL